MIPDQLLQIHSSLSYGVRRLFRIVILGVMTCFLVITLTPGLAAQQSILTPQEDPRILELRNWKQTEQNYRDLGDALGILGSQVNQAQILQDLGYYQQAKELLEGIEPQLQTHSDFNLRASGLRSLGTTLQSLGELDRSQDILEQALAASEALDDAQEIGATLLSLGNTMRAKNEVEVAQEYYQKGIQIAPDPLTQVQTQLNLLSLLVETEQWDLFQSLFPQVESALAQLPPSRSAIYSQVNFAQTLMKYGEAQPEENLFLRIAQGLANAINQGKQLEDSRATSYALGKLGNLYEHNRQWEEAQKLTEEALMLAQGINAGDIIYQWQWQLGRLQQVQGDKEKALSYYDVALETLTTLRQDLANTSEVQFSFRDEVEPFYRGFARLLLTPNELGEIYQKSLAQVPDPSQPHRVDIEPELLEKARTVIESLNIAEIDDFFKESCIESNPVSIDQIDLKASVIYPIILPDRFGVIVSLPDEPLSYYETVLSAEEITKTFEQFLQFLNPARSNRRRLALAQQIYDWMIKPAGEQLKNHDIETLVFVLDSSLSNLPMAALYDGEQYLIENYRVVLSSSLELINPRELKRPGIEALTGGLSEARQGFIALPGVEQEVNQIKEQVPSQVFLNEAFTHQGIENLINDAPFSVVHLATHGQFSSQLDQTFLLTWDELLNIKDFTALLQKRVNETTQPIELLVLSACQTAKGDDRATLGLAGLAVRSGVRSTLATLWSVNDQSTAELMVKFYQELDNPENSKADALRQSQLALLKNSQYQHPYFWAPFVLVGSWL